MNLTETILSIIGLPILGALVTYFLQRRKHSGESALVWEKAHAQLEESFLDAHQKMVELTKSVSMLEIKHNDIEAENIKLKADKLALNEENLNLKKENQRLIEENQKLKK